MEVVLSSGRNASGQFVTLLMLIVNIVITLVEITPCNVPQVAVERDCRIPGVCRIYITADSVEAECVLDTYLIPLSRVELKSDSDSPVLRRGNFGILMGSFFIWQYASRW